MKNIMHRLINSLCEPHFLKSNMQNCFTSFFTTLLVTWPHYKSCWFIFPAPDTRNLPPNFRESGAGAGPGVATSLLLQPYSWMRVSVGVRPPSRSGQPRPASLWWRDGRLSDDDGCDAAPQLILIYTLLPPQKLKCHRHQIVFILYNYKYLMWCIELLMQRVTWPADMPKTRADMTSCSWCEMTVSLLNAVTPVLAVLALVSTILAMSTNTW